MVYTRKESDEGVGAIRLSLFLWAPRNLSMQCSMKGKLNHAPFVRKVCLVANQHNYDVLPSLRSYIVDPF
jgi:hypothetical protein